MRKFIFKFISIILIVSQAACNKQLVDNSLKGTIGSALGKLVLSSPDTSNAIHEGNQKSFTILLNQKATKDIVIHWTAKDLNNRLVTNNGIATVSKGEKSFQASFSAISNFALNDSEIIDVLFESPDIFCPYTMALEIINETKPATLTAAPITPLVFPGTKTNATSTQSIVIQNSGDLSATAMNPSIVFPLQSFDYNGGTYPGLGGNCGNSLAPGATCILSFSFSPAITGLYDTGIINLIEYHNGANTTPFLYQIKGTGAEITATLSGGPSPLTNSTSINITVGGSGVSQYRFAFHSGAPNCAGATYGATQNIATPIQIIALTEGTYSLCVIGSDGSISQDPAVATPIQWQVDTSAPSMPSLTINGASSGYTNDTSAILSPFAISADEMYITTTSGCGSGGNWETYNVVKSFILNPNSANTVYIKYRDLAHNESACVSANQTHDNQIPNSPTALSLASTLVGLDHSPDLSFSLPTDNGPSGIDKYQARLIKQTDSSEVVGWQDFTSGSNFNSLVLQDGETYLYELRAHDRATNTSPIVQSSTFTPFAALVATFSGLPNNNSNVTNLNVTIGGTGVKSYRYKVGEAATLDCSLPGGYSGPVLISTPITDSINALPDGSIKLCAIGSDGVSWQAENSASATVWIKDTVPPTLVDISIAGGATHTNLASPVLTLSATSALEMYITNTAGCVADGIWENFNASKTWMLGQSNTTATVYAKFRDAALNESSCVSDSIIHDDIAPTLTIDISSSQSINPGVLPVNFSISVSEPILTNTFTYADLSNAGTLPTTYWDLTAISATTFNAHAVGGKGLSGTIRAQVAAGAFTDLAGNGNTIGLSVTTVNPKVENIAFRQIDGGGYFTCSLSALGQVTCWGSNYLGSLGDGTENDSNKARRFLTNHLQEDKRFTQIASGFGHSCAISENGKVYCWGYNDLGQLGNNSILETGCYDPPDGRNVICVQAVQVITSNFSPGEIAEKVSASGNNSCVITNIGKAYCWGVNDWGQLGDGTQINKPIAVEVDTASIVGAGFSPRFTKIAGGWAHSCGITDEGEIFCWGRKDSGRLGNGELSGISLTPVKVNSPEKFKNFASGGGHSCAINSLNKIYCWGWANGSGMLGQNNTSDYSSPTLIDTSLIGSPNFVDLAASELATCALTDLGTIYCWGKNDGGELGTGDNVSVNRPNLQVSTASMVGSTRFISISSGDNHFCANTASGNSYCWGSGSVGRLGNGATANSNIPVAVNTNSYIDGIAFTQLVSGTHHKCGLKATGKVYCWGSNSNGQLGDNSLINKSSPTLVDMTNVTGTKAIINIFALSKGTCAISDEDKLYCWGDGNSGQFLNLANQNYTVPTQVNHLSKISGTPGSIINAAGGDKHACLTMGNGNTYCWGDNSDGQLGKSDLLPQSDPLTLVSVGDRGLADTIMKISASGNSTCGVTTKNQLHCWGKNTNGQLGNGTISDVNIPKLVSSTDLVRVKSVSMSSSHMCFLTYSGDAKCSGDNSQGQLGSVPIDFRTPESINKINVSPVDYFTSIAVSVVAGHSCAVTGVGNIYCWGDNLARQVGDSTLTQRSLATQNISLGSRGELSAGDKSTCRLSPKGIQCWGENNLGQLGRGFTSASEDPGSIYYNAF